MAIDDFELTRPTPADVLAREAALEAERRAAITRESGKDQSPQGRAITRQTADQADLFAYQASLL